MQVEETALAADIDLLALGSKNMNAEKEIFGNTTSEQDRWHDPNRPLSMKADIYRGFDTRYFGVAGKMLKTFFWTLRSGNDRAISV